MKKTITLILSAVTMFSANATIRTITCQDSPSHFLPVTLNAAVGDTIHWTWIAGDHVVGPVNSSFIPTGAAMFNVPIDMSNHSFNYVVTVAGNYHYVCHPASPHGEDGYIVVSGTAGVANYTTLNTLFSIYPNPSSGNFQFSISDLTFTSNCKVVIYNIHGQVIYTSEITNSQSEIDLSTETKGLYFLEYFNGESILTKKIAIQ